MNHRNHRTLVSTRTFPRPWSRWLVIGALSLPMACRSSTANTERADDVIGEPDPACTDGETRCDGDAVATCAAGAFESPVSCEGDAICRDGSCREPTETQRAQADELASMLTFIEDRTAWSGPIDWGSLRQDGQRRIFEGDGSIATYFAALYRAFTAIPQGHQTFGLSNGCYPDFPSTSYSMRGACGQPHSRGVVVTYATAHNALGLKAGDLVTRVGEAGGSDVLARLAERPRCGASMPSTASRNAFTAATFSDLLAAGEEITVESPDGAARTIVVPASVASTEGAVCSDPFSRPPVVVESKLRSDGIAVIRLPSFVDPEQTFPTDESEASIRAYIETFEAKVQAAFDEVKTAPAIIWDLRGNGGGITLVGLDIASGFPGADAAPLSYCRARIPKTEPAEFSEARYAPYALTPGGRFAYTGKVAVLIDGQNYSAADYFPLAAKSRTKAILVGAPTSGAYGATSMSKSFQGPPAFDVGVDINLCLNAADDTPLEGQSTWPHVSVEYEPKDLAAGRDTVLERAAEALKQSPP